MTGQKTRRLLCTSRVYVPVGKTAPRAGVPLSLVRIIVREFPFREVLASLSFIILENVRRVWEAVRFLCIASEGI